MSGNQPTDQVTFYLYSSDKKEILEAITRFFNENPKIIISVKLKNPHNIRIDIPEHEARTLERCPCLSKDGESAFFVFIEPRGKDPGYLCFNRGINNKLVIDFTQRTLVYRDESYPAKTTFVRAVDKAWEKAHPPRVKENDFMEMIWETSIARAQRAVVKVLPQGLTVHVSITDFEFGGRRRFKTKHFTAVCQTVSEVEDYGPDEYFFTITLKPEEEGEPISLKLITGGLLRASHRGTLYYEKEGRQIIKIRKPPQQKKDRP